MPQPRSSRLEAALEHLAEAQVRTEERLEALTARVDTLTARVDALAEAQLRTEERLEALTARVDTLTARVDALAEAQRRTEERLEALAAQVGALTVQVQHLVNRVSALVGDVLELRYRQKAAGYFQRVLRRIHVVAADDLERLADDAESQGTLSAADHEDLLLADLVIQGRLRDRGPDIHLVAEISSIVDSQDVQRAARRAQLLERLVGTPVVAAVAGETITEEADRQADAMKMWRVLDGRAVPPGTLATRQS